MTDPRPGDFGLVNISGPVGLGIRVGQALNGDGFSRFEHAFVVTAVDEYWATVVEAMPGGARVATYPKTYGLYWSPPGLTDEQRQRIVSQAKYFIGTPYSFLDYAAIAAHRLGIPTPGLRNYISSTFHMICSQLVDSCYDFADVHLFDDGRWEGYVTPGDLYELTQGIQHDGQA